MSLSVCVRNVRATSQGGNITEGNMTCENIDNLKSVGYTIEYLDGKPEPDSTASSFEPIQEIEQIVEETIVEPIEELPIETIIIQEPIIQTLVIQQQDIFDNSLVLAETNATLKANNIELTNKNNDLESKLENVITQEELNKILLEKEIEKQYNYLNTLQLTTSIHPKTSGRELYYSRYTTAIKSTEIQLERFANSIGLEYTRRSHVNGEYIAYTTPPIEAQPSYIPTSSATVREF